MQETNANKPVAPEEADTAVAVMSTGMGTGTVKNFDLNRRYGFITQDDGTEVFVHQEALLDGTVVARGDRVSFQVTEGPKGPRAASVRKL